jgi:hypothetical protein
MARCYALAWMASTGEEHLPLKANGGVGAVPDGLLIEL